MIKSFKQKKKGREWVSAPCTIPEGDMPKCLKKGKNFEGNHEDGSVKDLKY